MKTKIFIIILTICFTSCDNIAKKQNEKTINFERLLKHINARKFTNDSRSPFDTNFKFKVSSKPIPFDITEKIIKNPYDSTYPISFSVIYQNKLISLFEQGKFVCHSISTLKRDKSFENKLNTKKFQYHWLIDSKLVGISNGKYYYLNKEDKWIEYSHDLPFTNQPKLFEDESYISFRDCFGEWGGTVYFFNKNNKKIFYTEATCANSILKRENKYFVLSHLGHMLGSAELKEISNPEKLSQVDIKKINKTVKGEALGYLDKSHASKKVFNWDYIQIFSSFKYENRTFYLVYYESETFLAEINNNTIYLVNPLFNNGFYTHQPITTSYDKTVLINLDFYMIGGEREISCIIIKDNKFIKLDWNENQTANTCL